MYQSFSNIINDVYRLTDEISPDNLDNKLIDIALKSKNNLEYVYTNLMKLLFRLCIFVI